MIYRFGIPNKSHIFKPILFADDNTLNDKYIVNLENKIKHNIDKLYSWLNINKFPLI